MAPPTPNDRQFQAMTIRTASDLQDMRLEPLTFILDDVLPVGVAVLAGKPKAGKSWFSLDCGLAVAEGGDALGYWQVQQGEVLYLALEDGDRRMQERIRKLLGDEPWPDTFHYATEWPRLDQGGKEKLAEFLESHPQTRLVVIDTYEKVRPTPAKNKGVYSTDYDAGALLKPLAETHNVAILLNHHVRKTPDDDPVAEVSGSFGFTGALDTILVLRRGRGQAQAKLHITGRDIEKEGSFAIGWDSQRAAWTVLGDADQHLRVCDKTT